MIKINLLAIVVLSFLSASAIAIDIPITTFGQLDQMRSQLRTQNLLLDLQVKNAELEKKLNELSGKTSFAPALSVDSVPNRFATVHSVSGQTAIITLPDGSKLTVKPGGRIPGLGVIKQISIHEVTVANGKHTVSLPFNPEMTTPAYALPPLPVPGAP